MGRGVGLGLLSLLSVAGPLDAHAQTHDSVVRLSLTYTGEATGVVSGGADQRPLYLDDLRIGADVDLEHAVGWNGGSLHILALNNSGGLPSRDAATLQSIDNLEVARPRARLYEAWVQQVLADGKGSLRVGLYDVSSEFYISPAAHLLFTPAFGVGRELAATGVNGPSIFPSTALAARLRWALGDAGYVQAAAVNAHAGVIGEPGGLDLKFDDGALLIAETGLTDQIEGKLAVGAWRYTAKQNDLRDVDAMGAPIQRVVAGAYVLAERALIGQDGSPRHTLGFARLGLSDGKTSPYKGGWQTGLLIKRIFDSRPDSSFSLGASQVWITDRQRARGGPNGQNGDTESIVEATYADTLGEHLTIQPDIKWIVRPAGGRIPPNAMVATLRFKLAY